MSKPETKVAAAVAAVNAIETLEAMSEKLLSACEKRGIDPVQWRTLANNLYPGAKAESIFMVVDYCRARKLDPLKKPCHIVPMKVKDARTGVEEWRDVVMPGIYEYRTTAMRTGLYLGHSSPEYGPEFDFRGLSPEDLAKGEKPFMVPEWCAMTFYRWNREAGQKVEFPVRVEFKEVVALNSSGMPNQRWLKSPVQMMTKCCEAAGLREAFPDEFGGEATFEEMERYAGSSSGPALPAPDAPKALDAPRDAAAKVGAIKDRLKAKTSASAPAAPPAPEPIASPAASPAALGPNDDGELTPEQLDLRRSLDAESDEIPY